MKKRILKFNLAILLLSILFGMFIFQVEQYSRDKVTDFFRYTDSYSPVKKPKKITNKKENDSAIDIIEKISKQEGLFTLYKVVDQGYFIKEGINFKFLEKAEITLYAPQMHQKSVYSPPLSKSVLTIDGIDNLKNKNEFEWQVFIKTEDKNKYKDTVEQIKNAYNKAFDENYTYKDFADFEKSENYELSSGRDIYNISSYLKIGIAFFIVMLSFWIFSVHKKIHILRQNGYSIVASINNFIGKGYATCIFASIALLTYLLGRISSIYCVNFMINIGLLLALSYVWLMLLVYVVEKLGRRKKESKNKGEKLFINVLPTAIKLIFLMMLVATHLDLARIMYQASNITFNSEVPKKISEDNYHVFYPVVVGKNQLEFTYDKDSRAEEEEEIYRYLNQKGSLLVSIQHYNTKENEVFGREIQLNPNYLKKFEILDENNQRVLIEESEEKRILLIPERFKGSDDLKKIEEYYFKDLLQFEDKLTEIIYIKDKQPVYSFVPNKPWIDDYPILDILTLKNSDSWERNIFSGAMYPPIKIKTAGKASEKLNGLLEKNKLTDNLPSFVPYEKSEITLIKSLSGSLSSLLISSLLTVFVFSIVCLLTTAYFFQYHNKKFYLLRLNGYSFFETYASVFLLLLFELMMGLTIAAFLSEISKEFVINIFLAMVLNVIIVSMTLFRVEKRQSN
ncbi:MULTISPECIES: DUF1430 domain-containing protein [Lactococcus]|uniref:DUF1430 domain-containing protein n=1 Tax=Lactococcus petauri TaxID=1940789 RepID=A0AAJ2MM81_9LACT|nr:MULTISPECIES: DUF1430 domain-containing protein [Lactococcus]MCH1712909.1 DUF1430 domain-containing protein [Lactococcus petauri]MDT2527323.1 DUF1430 domain-containing protein [Lactococcus petauri]MDT2542014.1 DUF1430 domain-containing protein [Lactococcus petauri]MDT2558613.1 DUF1430 domain-containing protein [Lactococcus petauri]MDT2560722.1 DUF1430 domain-containing protein [Lactococcus petauri]